MTSHDASSLVREGTDHPPLEIPGRDVPAASPEEAPFSPSRWEGAEDEDQDSSRNDDAEELVKLAELLKIGTQVLCLSMNSVHQQYRHSHPRLFPAKQRRALVNLSRAGKGYSQRPSVTKSATLSWLWCKPNARRGCSGNARAVGVILPLCSCRVW